MSKSFKEVTEHSPSTALVVDGLNLCFRWKHAKVTDFRDQFIDTVKSLADSYKCGRIIITGDQGSSTYRKSISPTYKISRKEKYANQTEAEAQAFKEFFAEYEATMELAAETFPVLRYQGVEADDIAAYIVEKRPIFDIDKIWLISSDGDWDLLIEEQVSRFSYVSRKEFTLDNWSTHYDVTPEEFISYKCLMGDKGDDVDGYSGIGPKRAAGIVQQYGDVFEIYGRIPLEGKYKYIETLNNNPELMMLNLELMDLRTFCSEAIGSENISDIERKLCTSTKKQ